MNIRNRGRLAAPHYGMQFVVAVFFIKEAAAQYPACARHEDLLLIRHSVLAFLAVAE